MLSSAKAHNVPIVSGRQMLTWLDGRNASAYSGISWSNHALSFTVTPGSGATGLTGMVPTASPDGTALDGHHAGGRHGRLHHVHDQGHRVRLLRRRGGQLLRDVCPPAPQAPAAPTGSKLTATKSSPLASSSDLVSTGTTAVGTLVSSTISALTVDNGAPTDSQSATFNWSTDAISGSTVSVGTSATSLTNQVKLGDATRKHAVTTDRLKPGVKYFYRVSSTDLLGRTATYPSADKAPAAFTTPTADIAPPKVTAARVTPLPGGIATVRWTTNEPSTAVVQVGEDTASMKEVARAETLSTSHALVLDGLLPNRTYYINGLSSDAAGNTGKSATLQFITPAWGVSEQGTPTFSRGASAGRPPSTRRTWAG